MIFPNFHTKQRKYVRYQSLSDESDIFINRTAYVFVMKSPQNSHIDSGFFYRSLKYQYFRYKETNQYYSINFHLNKIKIQIINRRILKKPNNSSPKTIRWYIISVEVTYFLNFSYQNSIFIIFLGYLHMAFFIFLFGTTDICKKRIICYYSMCTIPWKKKSIFALQ